MSNAPAMLQAWDCVGEAAIVAADILQRMCQHTPAGVLQRMVDAGCDVAIIGRHQVCGPPCCRPECTIWGAHLGCNHGQADMVPGITCASAWTICLGLKTSFR